MIYGLPNDPEPEYGAKIKQARDIILAALDGHERGSGHDSGEPCWDERINILAFLVHSMGIRADVSSFHFAQVVDRVREIEKLHRR